MPLLLLKLQNHPQWDVIIVAGVVVIEHAMVVKVVVEKHANMILVKTHVKELVKEHANMILVKAHVKELVKEHANMILVKAHVKELVKEHANILQVN